MMVLSIIHTLCTQFNRSIQAHKFKLANYAMILMQFKMGKCESLQARFIHFFLYNNTLYLK